MSHPPFHSVPDEPENASEAAETALQPENRRRARFPFGRVVASLVVLACFHPAWGDF
jgi:hypothetical protein